MERQAGEPTAHDSIYLLLRDAALAEDFAECARDPELRRLMTAYLSAGCRPRQDSPEFSFYGMAGHTRAWLAALREAKVDFSADAVRLAALAARQDAATLVPEELARDRARESAAREAGGA